MEKIFNQKNFNYLVWTPLGSKVNIYTYINFCLQVHFKESSLILFPCFVTGIVDTGGKFATDIKNTITKLVAKFAAGVIDTSGKFATSVVDTCGNLPPVSRVVHLDLQISLRTVLLGYSGVLGGN
jgi:hypothetical protein